MENGETHMIPERDLDTIIKETVEWLDQGESFNYALNQVLNRYNMNSSEHFSQVRQEMTRRSLLKREVDTAHAEEMDTENEEWWKANLADAVANEYRQTKLLEGEEVPDDDDTIED